MADGAAKLVDTVIPRVPVRQYVLSLPFETWGVLGFRPKLMNAVQKAFVDCVQAWSARRTREYGFPGGRTGAVLVLHRFNSALMIMPHCHVLLLDGVYPTDGVFHPFNAPDEAHLADLAEKVAKRVGRILERAAQDVDEDDPLKACTRAALQTGHRTRADDDAPRNPLPARKKLAVDVGGFNLEATTVIGGEDREALERMCRYLLRGPIALDRLHINEDGNAEYELKRPDRHGRTTLMMTPHELMARMTALIPAPRLCLRRTFGVRAPTHACSPDEKREAPTRTPWATLMERVFRFDPMKCGKCGGTLQLIACIRDKAEARRYLEGTAQDAELPAQGKTRKRKPP